ncbi:MAG: PKD domain-containing protein [bacterium]
MRNASLIQDGYNLGVFFPHPDNSLNIVDISTPTRGFYPVEPDIQVSLEGGPQFITLFSPEKGDTLNVEKIGGPNAPGVICTGSNGDYDIIGLRYTSGEFEYGSVTTDAAVFVFESSSDFGFISYLNGASFTLNNIGYEVEAVYHNDSLLAEGVDWTDSEGVINITPPAQSGTIKIVFGESPVAIINGPYSGFEGDSITLDGSASYDPDTAGAIISYEWDLDGDGAYDDASESRPVYIWNDDFTGLVYLRVTSLNGGQGVARGEVTILNRPLTAEAGGPYSGRVGEIISLAGTVFDPDDDILSYSWDLDGDGLYDDSTVLNPSFTRSLPGTYLVSLKVRENEGGQATDTATVEVLPPPGAPISLIFPVSLTAGNQFEVDIEVGDEADSVSDLLGISFCLYYPAQHLHLISADTQGILGSDLLSVLEPESQGKIRIGLSRKNLNGGFDGYGRLMSLKFRISEQAGGETLTLYLDEITAKDSGDQPIEHYSFPARMTVTDLPVWPGDLNNDGSVNEIDILPIASYWLLTGPSRPNASSNWAGQPSPVWVPVEATYADANGDGAVDEREVIVIGVNWGLSRSPGQGAAALNPGWTSDFSALDAYQTIFRFIRDIPESEAITRIRALLVSLIEEAIPSATKLLQNYPNPVNPETWIPFTLSKEERVVIHIYDLSGRLIRTMDVGITLPGEYTRPGKAAYWDGKDMAGMEVASGVYFYELKTGGFVAIRKMVVLR